jgi:hypothetical protein
MNTHPENPFTGLKGALAGLMSGGVTGWLLALFFRRHFAPAFAALERIYDIWKAGTLAGPAAPVEAQRPLRVRTPAPVSAPAAPSRPAGRRRASARARRPANCTLALRRRQFTWSSAQPGDVRLPSSHPPNRKPDRARCTAKPRRATALNHTPIITISE